MSGTTRRATNRAPWTVNGTVGTRTAFAGSRVRVPVVLDPKTFAVASLHFTDVYPTAFAVELVECSEGAAAASVGALLSCSVGDPAGHVVAALLNPPVAPVRTLRGGAIAELEVRRGRRELPDLSVRCGHRLRSAGRLRGLALRRRAAGASRGLPPAGRATATATARSTRATGWSGDEVLRRLTAVRVRLRGLQPERRAEPRRRPVHDALRFGQCATERVEREERR